MKKPQVCVIIPTLNEAESIGRVIDDIPRPALEAKGYQVEVMIIDGGSTDGTIQIAEEKGVQVAIEPRRGKGRAMRTALPMTQADYVFMLDGDNTYPPAYITEMLEMLHSYPVVIGSRLRGQIEPGGMSRLNLIGNHLLTLLANVMYRTRISDLCTGYWGFRGEVIPRLTLLADGFDFEAELFVQVAKKGYLIGEVPIYYRRRRTPPKLNSIEDGLKIAWALVQRRFRAN
ncbi:MAG: glycosyltransferase family 2 protein [Chloroflexota bacterium]